MVYPVLHLRYQHQHPPLQLLLLATRAVLGSRQVLIRKPELLSQVEEPSLDSCELPPVGELAIEELTLEGMSGEGQVVREGQGGLGNLAGSTIGSGGSCIVKEYGIGEGVSR